MEDEKKPTESEQIALEENETLFETEVERVKKKRREAMFELGLFLVLGILIGITLKTEAVKKITMGFSDYQIKKVQQSYDISAIKKKLEDQMAQQQMEAQAQMQASQENQNQEEK